jgi:hypothetical protein
MRPLMRNSPRKGEGGVSFKSSSVTLVTSPPRFSMFNSSPFPLTAFPYEPSFQAEIHLPPSRKRVARRNTTPGSSCRRLVRLFPLRNDKEHGSSPVATNARGIQSGLMVSIRVKWTNQCTAKTKGGCRWDASLTDGTCGRDQTTHQVRLTSGKQRDEGINFS